MPEINNLQDLRDLTIVAFTIAGTVLFLLGIIVALLLVLVLLKIRSTVSSVNRLVTANLPSALESLRETADTVRGTTSFLSETVVRPVARVYGIMAAGRRFVRVMARFRGGARRR